MNNGKTTAIASLSEHSFLTGIGYLTEVDAHLADVVHELGNPPMWSRAPGFPTLILIILEQQVSLASAKAAFVKLENALGEVTPERFLALTDVELREVGFSRQKTRYGRALAQALNNGELNLAALHKLDDAAVRRELTRIKGIGPWTAEIYLLMVLLRPDAWPAGDLALAKAAQEIKSLPARPGPDQLTEIAAPWQPWRAVAARILWHHYLSDRSLNSAASRTLS